MQFAWYDPQLEAHCTSGARLRVAAGDQVEAAEDLFHVVAQAPNLGDLARFRSVRVGVKAGRLTLSIEEVDMHARPLSPTGVPSVIVSKASLPDHSGSEGLLIDDLHVRGRSILRLAS